MVYTKYLFSFWESGILVCSKEGCLHDQPKIKTVGTESLMSFPVDNISHVLSHSLMKELSKSIVIPLSKDSWKLELSFLWTSPHVVFFFPLQILL